LFVVRLIALADRSSPSPSPKIHLPRQLTQRKKVVKSKGMALSPLRPERAKVPNRGPHQ
jgi:hypothetical protein